MSSKNHKELSVFGSVHSYEESNFNDLISFLVDKYRFSAIIIDDYKINYKKIIKNLDNDINVYRFSLQPKIDEKKYTIINSNPIYNNYNQTRHLLGTDYALISNKFKNLSKKMRIKSLFSLVEVEIQVQLISTIVILIFLLIRA